MTSIYCYGTRRVGVLETVGNHPTASKLLIKIVCATYILDNGLQQTIKPLYIMHLY